MSEPHQPCRKEPIAADVCSQTALVLRREAIMRGIRPDELIARCLDNIAKDNLFNAVLD
jgi:hypothetical protein